jgi:glycerol-3-phosphate acyltransferase PlsX
MPLPEQPSETTVVTVAVDALGGDHAPAAIVRGAVEFVRATGPEEGNVLLVGDETRVRAELEAVSPDDVTMGGRIAVHHASQVVEMTDHPMEAFKEKRDSSLIVCNKLVKAGQAHASFSAGHTGAMMVAATLILERIEGIQRPAIATFMPTEVGGIAVLLDAGANVDCRPKHLEHFALLGVVYAEKALGFTNPRVGILSNGEEESKGNELTKEAAALLVRHVPTINYIGYVEGNDLFEGTVDVAVCDGFEGNLILKAVEGAGRLALRLLAGVAKSATEPAAQAALNDALKQVRQRLDYAEYGGAPLLGVNGVAFIAHGRSDARAIANGIRLAAKAARSGYVEAVKTALAAMPD